LHEKHYIKKIYPADGLLLSDAFTCSGVALNSND